MVFISLKANPIPFLFKTSIEIFAKIKEKTKIIKIRLCPVENGMKQEFSINQHGGKRNALMYSLISCCVQHNIDANAYFVDVITRIGSHTIDEVKELLPHNWKPLNENATVASPAKETA